MAALNVPMVTSGFEQYMAQINQFAVLSREEELYWARRYRQQDDLEAAQQLICANLRFVVKIAQEYRNYGLKMLDLIQEGNIGLMMAVKKYEPERGIRLITYAVWWIRAYIHNYIIRSWSLVKIGTTQAQKKLFFKLKQTQHALQGEDTDLADPQAVAHELNVSDNDVAEMDQRLSRRDASLDVELTPGEDYSLMDTLADERQSQEENLLQHEEQQLKQQQVAQALACLRPRDRYIIEARLLRHKAATLQELADELGITRERVRQLEKNALKKMHQALNERASDI